MKKTILLSLLASAGLCSATTLNLTGFTNDTFAPTITGFDFGNNITVDITISGADNVLTLGLGSSTGAGTSGQLDSDETISFTFTNIQVPTTEGSTANISLLGLVSDAVNLPNGAFVFGAQNNDVASVSTNNGDTATISENDTADLDGVTLQNNGAPVPAQLSTVDAPIVVGEGDTISITPGAGDQFRIQGLQLEAIVVPEPTSVTLLGIGSLALLARRKRA